MVATLVQHREDSPWHARAYERSASSSFTDRTR
jgi:hypothetical protein